MSKNEIYFENSDCTKFLNKLPDNIVDLIVIDPPYIVTNEKWDKKEVVCEELSKELFRVAKNSCSLYVWCGIGEKSQSLIRWFPIFSKEWYFKDLITWKKQRGIGMRKGWLYIREEIMWFVKDNKRFVWNKEEQYDIEGGIKSAYPGRKRLKKYSPYKRFSNIWVDIEEKIGFKDKTIKHFTPKPIEAIERIIKLHTKENDLVLDCFMGSGTAAIACKNLNRKFIGCDNNKDYIELINERLKNHETKLG